MATVAHIALVDDIPDNTAVMTAIVEDICEIAQVTSFNSGIDFLSSFRCGTFDVIILDLFMPVMSGYTVLKELRKIDPDVPVIAVSADMGQRQKALEYGFAAFLTKPVMDVKGFCNLVSRFICDSRLKRSA